MTDKGGIPMRKVYLVIGIAAFLACLTGVSYLADGIAARGWNGVNYGRVVFPFLISGVSFWLFKQKKNEKQ